jgi:hypothetical protein
VAQTLSEAMAAPARPSAVAQLLRQPLAALASLRLTVVLLALSIVLVFVGTLAQIDGGIWTIVAKYFRSLVVFVPLQLFWQFGQVFLGLPDYRLPEWLGFPYPGGWTLGTLLLVNLVAAHVARFRLSWRRGGVLLLHAGLIVLMLGELVTGLFQVEARMTIGHGEAVNFTENSREVELAIIDVSDPKTEREVVIPERRLRAGGVIRHPDLPVEVEVLKWMKNAELISARDAPSGAEVFTSQTGNQFSLVSKDEAAGVDVGSHEDAATAHVRLLRRDGTEVARKTVSLWFSPNFTRRQAAFRFPPQGFTLDGKTYRVELRGRREYLPIALRLEEFRFDRYPGTETPRNYSSRVRLFDGSGSEGREIIIRMNEPLTHGGQTFYQSAYTSDEKGTIFQVTRNPGVLMPYVSCTMITLGMIWHFGLTLVGYLRRAGT